MKKKVFTLAITIGVLTIIFSCKETADKKSNSDGNKKETTINSPEKLYRPNFHFSPKKGWMNDPNGMFFYNGYYHLYFQHNPDSAKWGPMHWGHAISNDMISWREMPIAIYPDELGHVWSGSAVVDADNTSGFGEKGGSPVVAMYTYAKEREIENMPWLQTQGIAYSLDEGKTFTKFAGNPALGNPGIPDFRDPKVNWDKERQRWVMVLAAGQEIMFYASKNLKSWELLSRFGEGYGNHKGVWECPDFFPLPVKGTNDKKWVLFVSINPGGPNGGSATQYFVGDFDGTTFTLDDSYKNALAREHSFWIDHGRDNYAGVGWSNISTSDGGKLFIGWMSNWMYANQVPTDPWRNAMTTARELGLVQGDDTYRLVSTPVAELKNYRGKKYTKNGIEVADEVKLIGSEEVDLASAEIKFKIADLKDNIYKFKLSNGVGDQLLFGYDYNGQKFHVDRTKSGKVDFSEKFADRISYAPRTSNKENLSATILLDKTSIELFFDDGETVMTEIFFPNAPFDTFSAVSESKEFIIDSLEIHELNFN